MMKNDLSALAIYMILVGLFFGIQFFGSQEFVNPSPHGLIMQLYVVIGGLTLLFIIIALVVKKINKNHVGSVFLFGMIAKMAIVLALVVVNQEIKQNIYQLIVAYFLILLAEVLSFVKLLKNND